VATGQQTATNGVPYICVWDIGEYTKDDRARLDSGDIRRKREVGRPREPVQLQRLEVTKEHRSILAVAFSGNQHASAGTADRRGGELLAAITGAELYFVSD
jgi:hypothetical protein